MDNFPASLRAFKPHHRIILGLMVAATVISLSYLNSQSLDRNHQPSRKRTLSLYEGHYCVDGHAHWAAAWKKFFVPSTRSAGWREIKTRRIESAGGFRHPSPFVLLGPIVTAGFGVFLDDMILSYRLSSLLGCLLALGFVTRLAKRVCKTRAAILYTVLFVATNYAMVRSAIALHQEAWSILGVAAAAERMDMFIRTKKTWLLTLISLAIGITKVIGVTASALIAFCILFAAWSQGRISFREFLVGLAAGPLTMSLSFGLAISAWGTPEVWRYYTAISEMYQQVDYLVFADLAVVCAPLLILFAIKSRSEPQHLSVGAPDNDVIETNPTNPSGRLRRSPFRSLKQRINIKLPGSADRTSRGLWVGLLSYLIFLLAVRLIAFRSLAPMAVPVGLLAGLFLDRLNISRREGVICALVAAIGPLATAGIAVLRSPF